MIERAVINSRSGTLRFDIPPARKLEATPLHESAVRTTPPKLLTETEMRNRERENLLAALQKSNWKIYGSGGADELLRIKPTTLSARIKKIGLKKPA